MVELSKVSKRRELNRRRHQSIVIKILFDYKEDNSVYNFSSFLIVELVQKLPYILPQDIFLLNFS